MLKHALNYWGIKNTDDLDPSIKMILEALSSELYSLGHEIKNSQVHILEKISSMLAPDFLTCPNPAHAIMHAMPAEPTEQISAATSFFTQTEIPGNQKEKKNNSVDVFFTPVDNVQLFDANMVFIAAGSSIYANDASYSRQLFARTKSGRSLENNALWIGIKSNPSIDNLHKLFFCFDWKNMEPKIAQRLYQLLPLTKWYFNEKEIETTEGLQYAAPPKGANGYENIFAGYDLLSLIEKDIKQFYNNKYITITSSTGELLNELKQNYPPQFKTVFADSDLQKLAEKLLWIKVVFPAAMQQENLDEIYVYLNAFPVINRQLNDLKYRLKGGSNIVPLKTGLHDQFLAVKSLSDESHLYEPLPYRKAEEEPTGTYSLRIGGTERFDERNAKEFISYLLELLRSESAAFSIYGYDFIAATLKEMNQKISLMEQKTSGAINTAEVPNYIIVKPFEEQDMMYAEYWTTHAEIANMIRAGAKLQQHKGAKIKPGSAVLLSTTTGGKKRLRPEERLNAFRYGIMTRNRIITKEDIRNLCFYELGDKIQDVAVQRGFEMSAHIKEAFRRTIDVILTPAENGRLDNNEWELLCGQLKAKLVNRSGMSHNYRIMMKE